MTSSRRSARSTNNITTYNEIDSDDENEKFKSIIGYESGSDFEENLKEYEGDDSDEENGPDDWLTDNSGRVKRTKTKRVKVDGVFVPWTPGQRTMATAGRTKINTDIEKGHFGPVPGIEVGQSWQYRIQLSENGVHAPPVAGISGTKDKGCNSLVLAGGYSDDKDLGYEFTYSGSGGRDLSGNKRTAEQSFDQTLTKSNAAIAVSCNAKLNEKKGNESTDWQKGKPIRVCRSYKFKKFSKYAPEVGVRYDGIYKVVKYYPQRGDSGFLVWKYVLRRDDPSPSPWEKSAKKYECEMYIQNHVAIEPTNDDAIENDKENNENKNENSFAIKQENTEDNEPATKGSKQLQTWYEQSNNLTIKQSKTKVKSENNTENDSKSQDEDEKNQPKSKKSKSVEKPADKKSKQSKTKIADSENITEDDSKSQDEAEKTQLKSKKCNEKPISRKKDKLKTEVQTEESDNDLEVSFKENEKVDVFETKQEVDEAKPRKSRRSSNTSLNCGENQNPLQEVGQNSKPDRDSGKKPGLQQKTADKENEKVTAVEIKQEIDEAKPRKSRRSANTSLTSGENQNPLQEVGQTSKSDRDSGVKTGLKQTNNSLKKESPIKNTKNSGKRKREILEENTDNDNVMEQKTRRSKRAKID